MSWSCDYFDKSPDNFIGEIYLKTSVNSKYLIYGEKYSKDGFYSFLLNEPVQSAMGNDSVIYVKCISEGASKYYIINHFEGKKILKTIDIDSLNYINRVANEKFKYTYFTVPAGFSPQ